MNLLFLNLGAQELVIILPLLVLFFYTAYHAVTNKSLTTYQRSLWILIIVLGNLLGWILYWAIGKKGDAIAPWEYRRNKRIQ
ncbi:PLDc N-terminal domain-containing protein [Sphingobacterium sp. DN00404]|uniref:PLDc N-terminal domain-containing protein n=1 Tax=Sphingobacterium micropteri TaxID=2763501 RepID=A0ABR7YRG2_9SPHI|nr:PLDc N-terminal domain-containing protein [Sphingobacterium micropteri]MBD1433768.1 PLDc N-terminal domain-containing protein [Sphingobacterium micropteri]